MDNARGQEGRRSLLHGPNAQSALPQAAAVEKVQVKPYRHAMEKL
jgi:hypothetical protein